MRSAIFIAKFSSLHELAVEVNHSKHVLRNVRNLESGIFIFSTVLIFFLFFPHVQAKKKSKKDDGKEEEEVLDWWTRFYETLRDMEGGEPKKKKIKVGLKLGGNTESEENAERAKIPRLTVFSWSINFVIIIF